MPTNPEMTLKVEAKVIALMSEVISNRLQMESIDATELTELKALSTDFMGRCVDLNTNIQALT